MELLFNEPSPIPLHAFAAMIAIVLGGIQLYMKKGGKIHKLLGRIWIGLMLVVSISSFWIHDIRLWGLFSPIHILSAWTIFSCGMGIYFARVGKIKAHKYTMVSMYFLALILTGAFTLLPGRLMNQIIFG